VESGGPQRAEDAVACRQPDPAEILPGQAPPPPGGVPPSVPRGSSTKLRALEDALSALARTWEQAL